MTLATRILPDMNILISARAVLRTDHAAVPLAGPLAILAEGSGAVVAATVSDDPVRGSTLTLREVSHCFDLEGQPLPVLDRISLQVGRGEFVALLGPSGCGKSTLLRLVAGLDTPTDGSLLTEGREIKSPDPSRVVVFQDPTLYPWRTVWSNVALGLEARGLLRTHRGRIEDALRLVGLTGCQCLPAPAFRRHGATRGSGARAGQRPKAAHSRRAFGPARTR